ncbi:hypothetical protein CEXT_317901 [Caerostris extrusa]|uniref:LAGLIDADG homing endonuclease n=1 Tax=Caerostris extrusa TaxID=172846 RepID=A0AAV4X3J8_CAEEX|nr:hypothetical protein CEXT_317901 [Caerostris extrusa]
MVILNDSITRKWLMANYSVVWAFNVLYGFENKRRCTFKLVAKDAEFILYRRRFLMKVTCTGGPVGYPHYPCNNYQLPNRAEMMGRTWKGCFKSIFIFN